MSQDGAPRLGPTRAEVLHHLRRVGEPSPVSAVAAAVGLHPNTTRFHLDALAEARLVVREVEQRNRPGRPRVLYRAAHGHRRSRYHDLAAAMVTHFAGGVRERGRHALVAGEEWGDALRSTPALHELDPLARVVDAMQGLGYQPKLLTGPDTRLQLGRCPYLDLAQDDPEVVCQLHLGLVRGLLGPDQPWTVRGIEPWATPTTCLVRLAPGTGAVADA